MIVAFLAGVIGGFVIGFVAGWLSYKLGIRVDWCWIP